MSRIYFASDVHLGFPNLEKSKPREKIFVKWLDQIKTDADEIYLLGDIFDFWWEYKKVVPRGFTRFLGKISEITDAGIPVHFFTGNHDIWLTDYLSTETGVKIYRKPITRTIDNKRFMIGHGDGLGPGDRGYKLLKSIFENKLLQWLYSRIHPNTAIGFGHRWSNHSRLSKGIRAEDINPETELLIKFIKSNQDKNPHDIYVFGHRHVPMSMEISNAHYINLGDWITHFTYAVWDGAQMTLKSCKK